MELRYLDNGKSAFIEIQGNMFVYHDHEIIGNVYVRKLGIIHKAFLKDRSSNYLYYYDISDKKVYDNVSIIQIDKYLTFDSTPTMDIYPINGLENMYITTDKVIIQYVDNKVISINNSFSEFIEVVIIDGVAEVSFINNMAVHIAYDDSLAFIYDSKLLFTYKNDINHYSFIEACNRQILNITRTNMQYKNFDILCHDSDNNYPTYSLYWRYINDIRIIEALKIIKKQDN